MKKTLALLAAIAVTWVASASFKVDLQNVGAPFSIGGDFNGQFVVQLVYNDTTNPQQDAGYTVYPDLKAPGDTILEQFTTTLGFAGTWSDKGDMGGVYTNSLSGYLTVRVFDTNNLAVGALGWEFDVDIDGSLTPYDALTPSTVYKTDASQGGPVVGGEYNDLVAGNMNVVQIIPDYSLVVLSDHGSPSPSVGTNMYGSGSNASCSVNSPVFDDGTNYVCTGWTGTGDVPASGSSTNTGSFTINQNSSITWNWEVMASEYWLDVTIVGGGSLNVADGWQPNGTNLALTATPSTGWLFMGWSGDLTGDCTQTNTSLLMNADKSITATFSNDADSDGLPNTLENSLGTDPRDNDSDDDGLLDAFEVYIHNTDPLDPDTDDDNLNDGPEVSLYETDPLAFDSDGDGLGDGEEALTYLTNPLIADSDGDGLSDGDEINIYSTNPLLIDTDGDSLSDYEEVVTYNTNPNLSDSDADGLNDYSELNTHLTDPNDADSDDDGLTDGQEINTYSTDPNDADSDDDGLSDGLEINTYNTNPNLGDTSGDGIMDGYAVLKGLDPTVDYTGIYAILMMNKVGLGDVTPDSDLYPSGTNLTLEATGSQGMLFTSWSGSITGDYTTALTNITLNGHMDITAIFSDDADGDGILNTNETVLGTDPYHSDSDSDGLSDPQELYTYFTDPLVWDMDGDGLSDGEEILTYNTDPQVIDTDLDGFGDGYEVSTGYDPATTNSTPELYATIKTSIQFEFNAAIGQTYRIEGTEALSSPWQTMEAGIVGSGGIVTRHYDIDVETNKFFRAKRD